MREAIKRSALKRYLWGAGNSAVEFLESYPSMHFDAVIETNPTSSEFMGHQVVSPDSVDLRGAEIIVASEFVDEIRQVALAHGASPGNVRPAHTKLLDDADVAFVSYQKCGRTWVRLMLGRVFQVMFDLPESEVLRITQSPMRFKETHRGMPAIVFHHDDAAHRKTASELDRSKTWYREKRVIFLCRDPRDVVLSNYYHMTFRAKSNKLDVNGFVRKYFAGIIGFYNAWALAELDDSILVPRVRHLLSKSAAFSLPALNKISHLVT